jgi:hypothetical protein
MILTAKQKIVEINSEKLAEEANQGGKTEE